MTDRLHEIKCPALIICGDQDFLKPIKFSQIIAGGIEKSEFVILPNCGHVSIFEKPNELQTLLSGFVLKNM
jgi:3-oxoadipate enol-lactonase